MTQEESMPNAGQVEDVQDAPSTASPEMPKNAVHVYESATKASGDLGPANTYMSTASVVSVKKEECVSKLSWHNLEYTIPSPNQKGQVKTLLSNVHGEVLAGEVIGIMGGSGKFYLICCRYNFY